MQYLLQHLARLRDPGDPLRAARRRPRAAGLTHRQTERTDDEARRAHRLLGHGPHERGPARRSSRRPSASATTRSGPRRPTGRTRRRSSAGSPGRRRRSGSGRRSSRSPARSAAMTAMTAATIDQLSNGRMILGIGIVGAAGQRGLARRALRQAARPHARLRRGAADGAARASALEYKGETLELPLPDGPGKALKLTIAHGAGARSRSSSRRSGRRTRSWRPRSPTA